MLGDDEDLIALLGVDLRYARKHTECGQNALMFSEIKTRQGDRLLALAAKVHAGVNVAREVIASGYNGFRRMVGHGERSDVELLMYRYFFALILVGAHNVVVADDELEGNGAKMADDLAEDLPGGIIMTVKQVAQTEHALRPGEVDQVDQVFKAFIARLHWHGYTRFAKVVDLAQVEIRQQQGRLLLPIHSLLREQLKFFPGYRCFQVQDSKFRLKITI